MESVFVKEKSSMLSPRIDSRTTRPKKQISRSRRIRVCRFDDLPEFSDVPVLHLVIASNSQMGMICSDLIKRFGYNRIRIFYQTHQYQDIFGECQSEEFDLKSRTFVDSMNSMMHWLTSPANQVICCFNIGDLPEEQIIPQSLQYLISNIKKDFNWVISSIKSETDTWSVVDQNEIYCRIAPKNMIGKVAEIYNLL